MANEHRQKTIKRGKPSAALRADCKAYKPATDAALARYDAVRLGGLHEAKPVLIAHGPVLHEAIANQTWLRETEDKRDNPLPTFNDPSSLEGLAGLLRKAWSSHDSD